jgi:hypothetical protein
MPKERIQSWKKTDLGRFQQFVVRLADTGNCVIAGLDTDYLGRPFHPMRSCWPSPTRSPKRSPSVCNAAIRPNTRRGCRQRGPDCGGCGRQGCTRRAVVAALSRTWRRKRQRKGRRQQLQPEVSRQLTRMNTNQSRAIKRCLRKSVLPDSRVQRELGNNRRAARFRTALLI